MKTLVQSLGLALLSIATAGCHSTEGHFARVENEPEPVPENVRDSFGIMGILPMPTTAKFNFKHPANTSEAADAVMAKSFDSLTIPALSNPDLSAEELLDAVAISTVVAGVTGVLGGIFAGVPEGDLKRAEKEIQQALADKPLEPGIAAHLKKIAAVTHTTNLVVIPESTAARMTEDDLASSNFSALTNSSIRSVLIVRVVDQGFFTKRTLNPVMPVDIILGIEVVRISDGRKLFFQPAALLRRTPPIHPLGSKQRQTFPRRTRRRTSHARRRSL